MSYSRGRYYIYPHAGGVNFVGVAEVPDDYLNVWLYKMLLANRREELVQRVQEGRRITHAEAVASKVMRSMQYAEWMSSREDDLVKQLLQGGAP